MAIIKKYFSLLILISILLSSCKTNSNKNSIVNIYKHKVPIKSFNEFIDAKMKEMNINGLSLAIINNGQIAYHTVKGYADVEEKKLVTNETLFEGASISKPLFAYTAMKLVDDGLLDIDKPLYKYWKDKYHGISDDDFEAFKTITARMVLSHSSGFPNWRSDWNHLDLLFKPGTAFGYSGEGYMYLERTIEIILNTDYKGVERYFQNKVASQLKMSNTSYLPNAEMFIKKASPYRGDLKLERKEKSPPEFNAAAMVHSEALDYSKFVCALLDRKGLTEKSLNALFTDNTLITKESDFGKDGVEAWTLGLSKYKLNSKTLYGHIGNNEGFTAMFLMEKDTKWAIVVFTNGELVSEFGFDLFRYLNQNN